MMGQQSAHDGNVLKPTVSRRAHLDRRMLQFWARRPSMTDSSLTFLEVSVSSSASFCQQSDEQVRICKYSNEMSKICIWSHQQATTKGNLRSQRSKNTGNEHSWHANTNIYRTADCRQNRSYRDVEKKKMKIRQWHKSKKSTENVSTVRL